MRAVRFLTLVLLMGVGVAGTAMAQAYNNTPGTYTDIKVGVVPAMLPPGSLPAGFPSLGPDLYIGTLTVAGSPSVGYTVQYKGERTQDNGLTTDGAKLNVNASFSGDWAGFKLDTTVVGSTLATIIFGDDVAHLLSANVNGVGTVDGKIQRLIAHVGAGGTVNSWKVNPAPGNLR